MAGLLEDLKNRDLLKDTLVIWGGEFGRSPVAQKGDGRDHHPYGFSMWLAGGGVKRGYIHGATDEFGYRAIEQPVSCPSLLATLLHRLGIDHTRLTYRHNGREETMTDAPVTGARVVQEVIEVRGVRRGVTGVDLEGLAVVRRRLLELALARHDVAEVTLR